MPGKGQDLSILVGAPLLGGTLTLTDWKPLKLSGWFGFTLCWEHTVDHRMEPPLFHGIFSRGDRWIAPWADMGVETRLVCKKCGHEVHLKIHDLTECFKLWSRVIPWNGHISVEYESAQHQETLMGLKLGIPAVLTPIGYAGYLGGFIGGFKDWYIAEGGHEGPRKLQMNKPLDLEHALRVYEELKEQVNQFLGQPPKVSGPEAELWQHARERAQHWQQQAATLMDDLLR